MGIILEDKTIYSLLLADDQVIMAEDEDDISYMFRKSVEEYENGNKQKGNAICGCGFGRTRLENGETEILKTQRTIIWESRCRLMGGTINTYK